MTDAAQSYEVKSSRSITLLDSQQICAYARLLAAVKAVDGAYLDDASVLIASDGGYVIGEIWWDGDGERWVLDFDRYGEPR